ncbi:MAG: class I SAM-dependent methyltransferase [Acholeplasmataceae bacterium]
MSFAEIYDILMSDIDYEEIYNFIMPYIENKKVLIDAGCGSGYLTTYFAKDFETIALDIDEDMLALTSQKLMENHLHASLFIHDLNDEITINADAIVACFDVLNYFKNPKHVLKNFYQALNKDGVLIFDVYKYEMLEAYQNYDEKEIEPIKYQWHIDVKNNKLVHQITVDKKIDLIVQYVKQSSYYLKILDNLGFITTIVEGPDERKLYFIAKK